MNGRHFICIAALVLSFHFSTSAATFYVNAANPNPVSPYNSWATAATNIEDAAAIAGFNDTVLVTNGIYQYGGTSFNGSNRVRVVNSVLLQSVNGPAVTTIVGYQVPGTTNGPNAIRCVYLSEFSRLAGFTLTHGATIGGGAGGGVVMESFCTVSNCVIVNNAATTYGGGCESVNNGTVINCCIGGNISFAQGGGALGCTLVNCVITNNSAPSGGAVFNSTVYDSLLVGNGTLIPSSAAVGCTLNNCTVSGNFSTGLGAAQGCRINNSIIYYNSNGASADCYQCLLTNSCTSVGGGIISPFSNGCISNAPSFVNLSGGNYHLNPWSRCIDAGKSSVVTNSTDLDGNPRIAGAAVDMGCYESQPLAVSVHYVSLNSTNPVTPYTNWLTAATNLQSAVAVAQAGDLVAADDGVYTNNGGIAVYGAETNCVALTNAITLVSAGGPLAAMIVGGPQTRCAYVGPGALLSGFTLTNGQCSGSSITNEQSGGGVWCDIAGVVSNCFIIGNKANTTAGLGGGIFGGTIYNSTITNNNYGYGAAARTTLYNCTVSSNGWNSGSQYSGGLYYSTASNCVIAANRAYFGGAGVYHSVVYNSTITGNQSQGGGGAGAYQSQLFNCSLLTNISAGLGGGAYASLLTNCTVSGNFNIGAYQCTNYNCTFSGNHGSDGGGVNGGLSYGCIFSGNSGPAGGGAQNGTFYNCLFTQNFANNGGGAYGATLYNCTVVGNTATNSGGGVYSGGSVNNSIVYYNNAPSGANYSGVKFNNSCAAPPTFGIIVSNAPVFVNLAGGDYHEQTNSPTINSGSNQYLTSPVPAPPQFTNNFDLDGNPRVVGGTVDIGAYEYQGSNYNLPIPIAWLIQYGLPTDGSANYVDSDGTGMNNWQKWIAGLNPINPASVLAVSSPLPASNGPGLTVTWQSVNTRTYFVQSSTNLSAGFSTIQNNLAGQSGTTSYTDTTATNGGSYYYRVGVQ